MFNASKLRNSLMFKLVMLSVLALLLLIPALLISGLVRDRESQKEEAVTDIASKWAGTQQITGPYLSIPYTRYTLVDQGKGKPERIESVRAYWQLLPENLTVEGEIMPEKRHRGIFDVMVYRSTMLIKGQFSRLDWRKPDVPEAQIHYNEAELVMGISDLRGIKEQPQLKFGANPISFKAGISNTEVVESGIHAPITLQSLTDAVQSFEISLNLNGSQSLKFVPMGRKTDVSLRSTWPSPSFNGSFLPDSRQISDQGFSAQWSVLHLNRNFPQSWSSGKYNLDESAFGLDLLSTAGNYQKIYRALNYALLFIGFTFLIFFFVEVLKEMQVHPLQYLLVGFALLIFFTLLLSISEYLSFNLSYGIATVATLGLIGGYVKSILRSGAMAGLMTALLGLLYTFIFIILQLEDLALLIGSIGMFCILATVMFLSRKVDWYGYGKQPTA